MRQPNIVFILADDMGYGDFGVFNQGLSCTPTLDELTRENLTAELFQLWSERQPTVMWVTHNIYEALKIADRVLVFSPQPGKIIADYLVNQPPPRK